MFSNEPLYNDIDTYNSGNRLFTLNDSQNIWSSDKMCPIDNNYFMKNRNVFNNIQVSDRFNRTNRKPPGNRTETNLIVNYLPDGFYEKDLYELFSKAGQIVHYHVVRNKDNRSECYGFVDYDKPSDAEKAIEMFHQYQIQNKKLKVQNASEGLQIKEEEKLRAIKGFNNIGYNVEIRNAPIRWTVSEVKNIFGKYGEILKVYESTTEEITTVDNSNDIKSKTFNIIFRYHTIAAKVVKKKNNQIAEAMWPLQLELSIVSQEIVDIPTDSTRVNRPRPNKMRFDQLSESSWENKVMENNYYQKSYESPTFNWAESIDAQRSGVPLSANGRPILKHKDNLMHLNGGVGVGVTGMYDVNSRLDNADKWSNMLMNDPNNFFDTKLPGSCNDIKAIWESKELLLNDITPQDVFVKTPLLPSRFRGDDKTKYKANIWFKMENMQPTGSFKLRGMAYWCYKAKLDGVQLVVSSSGGNAGLAAAYACRMLKLKCTVVVSHATPVHIIGELLKENAEVIQEGSCWKEAHMKAESIVATCPRISRLCHPFDSPLLWSGYESIVDEIVTDMKGARLDMIVCSVGGGGLLNGIAQGITKNKLNKTTAILAMETEGAACFNQSLSVNHIVSIEPDSIATSLGASSISQRTWEIYCNKEFHLFSKICSDAEAIDGCCQFLSEQNCLVEPACGATLSALYNGTLDQMAECRECDLNVAVIVCGGRCIDVNSLIELRQVFSALINNPIQTTTAVAAAAGLYGDNLSNYDITDRFLTMNLINKDHQSYHHNHHQPTATTPIESSSSTATAVTTDMYYASSSASASASTNRFDPSIPSYNNMFPSLTKNNNTVEPPATINTINTINNCGGSGPGLHKSNILTENKYIATNSAGGGSSYHRQRNNNNNLLLNESNTNNSLLHHHHNSLHHHHYNYQMSSSSINTNNNNNDLMLLQQQNSNINNNNNNNSSSNSNSYLLSNDLMSSPVGSQHSDKENRMIDTQ